jgi:predicted alpha/beta-fold hydrolase
MEFPPYLLFLKTETGVASMRLCQLLIALGVVSLMSCFNTALGAGDSNREQLVSVTFSPPTAPIAAAPANYDYGISDGLYATVTANSFDTPKVDNETKVKLRPEGFKKDIEAKVIWQAGRKPLAVLLLGLASRSKDKMAQLWKCHLREAGFHVMTFDSPFLPVFSERSRHGVAGNVAEESQLVANLVAAFLSKSDVRERVTSIGVVGISYGGTLALNISKMAQEGRCPFKVDRVLAFSPPVRMRTAAQHLDLFFQDRWNYTLSELSDDLLGHKPVAEGQPVPFPAAEMRAGIAAAFRMDLEDIVEFSDRFYKLGILPQERSSGDAYRKDVAGTWSFERFVGEMSFAYWKQQGKVDSPERLWDAGDLTKLLQNCPSNTHVVIAVDDPLSDPSELSVLRSMLSSDRLTVLPRGGHMGYNATQWVKNRVARLFE